MRAAFLVTSVRNLTQNAVKSNFLVHTNYIRSLSISNFHQLHTRYTYDNSPTLVSLLQTTNHHLKSSRLQSTEAPTDGKTNGKPDLTVRQKLQKAVAEYGSTVIVFHVGISLISLGGCYLAVSSGVDIGQILLHFGLGGDTIGKIASNAGTFALAYGVHKVFAPVRIGITLTATPFIVRYLRTIGFLKK